MGWLGSGVVGEWGVWVRGFWGCWGLLGGGNLQATNLQVPSKDAPLFPAKLQRQDHCRPGSPGALLQSGWEYPSFVGIYLLATGSVSALRREASPTVTQARVLQRSGDRDRKMEDGGGERRVGGWLAHGGEPASTPCFEHRNIHAFTYKYMALASAHLSSFFPTISM